MVYVISPSPAPKKKKGWVEGRDLLMTRFLLVFTCAVKSFSLRFTAVIKCQTYVLSDQFLLEKNMILLKLFIFSFIPIFNRILI